MSKSLSWQAVPDFLPHRSMFQGQSSQDSTFSRVSSTATLEVEGIASGPEKCCFEPLDHGVISFEPWLYHAVSCCLELQYQDIDQRTFFSVKRWQSCTDQSLGSGFNMFQQGSHLPTQPLHGFFLFQQLLYGNQH